MARVYPACSFPASVTPWQLSIREVPYYLSQLELLWFLVMQGAVDSAVDSERPAFCRKRPARVQLTVSISMQGAVDSAVGSERPARIAGRHHSLDQPGTEGVPHRR
jgi:hypothetical protein